jgi:hypothetical protein
MSHNVLLSAAVAGGFILYFLPAGQNYVEEDEFRAILSCFFEVFSYLLRDLSCISSA